MTPPTNNTDPQIAILEARMDSRISSVEVTFANFVKVMDEREKVSSERHKASEARMDRMEAMIAEMRASIASLRITIVVTGITSVLAAVLGISAFNAALYSNMLAALSAGKEMASIQAEVKKQAEQTAVLIKNMQAEQEKNKPAKPSPSD